MVNTEAYWFAKTVIQQIEYEFRGWAYEINKFLVLKNSSFGENGKKPYQSQNCQTTKTSQTGREPNFLPINIISSWIYFC